MRRDCAGKVDAVEVSNAVQIAPLERVVADASGGHGTVWQLLLVKDSSKLVFSGPPRLLSSLIPGDMYPPLWSTVEYIVPLDSDVGIKHCLYSRPQWYVIQWRRETVRSVKGSTRGLLLLL